ncbi:pro-sigmaK processing inhibitor BofA family protein [Priestia flexa]|uniref:Pro-sigmaK processing inhibitor BofA family protein n=1 Tax=Priestia flexa TaxID=86664 RepID=A0ABU4JAY1_9BACI|nr:pro-sigmaK processing inhibitor BofA family protein [Priestia flexa]MDW8518134.1 pro-sigmaK processing inhibitor BofA family protein [Priestia flexa]
MLTQPLIVIPVLAGLIVLLLIKGGVENMFRIMGNLTIKLIIGVLLLFFINIFGAQFDIHIPINAPTAIISGVLGVPGIIGLFIINQFVL